MKDTKFCVCIDVCLYMCMEVCIDNKLVTQICPKQNFLLIWALQVVIVESLT